MFLKHINHEKMKYVFQFKILELKFFESAFKKQNVDLNNETFFVNTFIFFTPRYHIKEEVKEREKPKQQNMKKEKLFGTQSFIYL
jgi:hypothetical protein